MNIWLVNPFDSLPGEKLRAGRYACFAQVLGEAGHAVTWWTSTFSHASKSCRDDKSEETLPSGLRIVKLQAPAYSRNVSFRRVVNHCLWATAFFDEARRVTPPPDVVITSSPPIYAANRALRVAHRGNAKVVVDVQDLWPEAFGVLFPPALRQVGLALFWPLKALEDSNFRRADGLTAISQTLLGRALTMDPGKRVRRVIPLGVDVEVYARASRIEGGPWEKPDGEFWVVYVGTIGKTYDIDIILQSALLLKEEQPRIRFFIVGSGPLLSQTEEKARRWGLSNVIFTGFLPLDTLAQLLVRADLGLNAIVPGAVPAFPNKIFDYLAAGLPIVNSVKGELETFIRQHSLGATYEASQAESLREAILELHKEPELRAEMGTRGRRLAREMFDRRVAYRALLELISELSA